MKNINYKLVSSVLLIFVLVLSWYHANNFFCDKSYKFVSNQCEDLIINKKAYLETKTELERYFEEQKSLGKITEASVYFRDLNRGPVMGIDETVSFTSASLLKVPVVITVLKIAEDRPDILDIHLVNEGIEEVAVLQSFVPDEKIKNNVSYTVRDVIRHVLVYSDNTALSMLHDFINIVGDENNNLPLVFRELGLLLPDDLLDRDISTRAYASLFRQLYTSSYLSQEYSEMILSDLSTSNFTMGLKSGVPADVTVANKYGERFIGDTKQLHDCGIVYYPKNPYLLCVMTQGNDFQALAEVIAEVSRILYREVDSRKL